MARYMYGDTELNHTLININDSTPGPNSAYSSNKTNDLLAAAASAAEATYFKKSDIQSSVNTSNNPPSSNAVTNALAAKATIKTNTLTAADSCVPPDGTSAVYSGTGDNAQLKATRNGNTTIQELQSADGNISTRTGTLNGTTWTWTAWQRLALASEIVTTKVNNAVHADSASTAENADRADVAASADYAVSAGSALRATNADSAASCSGYANFAHQSEVLIWGTNNPGQMFYSTLSSGASKTYGGKTYTFTISGSKFYINTGAALVAWNDQVRFVDSDNPAEGGTGGTWRLLAILI